MKTRQNLWGVLFFIFSMTSANAQLNTIVSISPQKTFVEAIGGEKINVSVMVKAGASPHTYEPKPSQMKDIAKARLYFAIDVEFEKTWLPKFSATNPKMRIIDLDKGITKIAMSEHHHEDEKHSDAEEDHEDKTHDHHDGLDPHIWTSPSNVKIIAKTILNALIKEDPSNEKYYTGNYENFLIQIEQTDIKIREILKDVPKGSKFMVFHPAWGYFARDYNLEQVAIEAVGKEPKPKQVVELIDEVKEKQIKAIFTAPEFSEKTARQIANEANIQVVKISPLDPDWSENLIKFAKAIMHK